MVILIYPVSAASELHIMMTAGPPSFARGCMQVSFFRVRCWVDRVVAEHFLGLQHVSMNVPPISTISYWILVSRQYDLEWKGSWFLFVKDELSVSELIRDCMSRFGKYFNYKQSLSFTHSSPFHYHSQYMLGTNRGNPVPTDSTMVVILITDNHQ